MDISSIQRHVFKNLVEVRNALKTNAKDISQEQILKILDRELKHCQNLINSNLKGPVEGTNQTSANMTKLILIEILTCDGILRIKQNILRAQPEKNGMTWKQYCQQPIHKLQA